MGWRFSLKDLIIIPAVIILAIFTYILITTYTIFLSLQYILYEVKRKVFKKSNTDTDFISLYNKEKDDD